MLGVLVLHMTTLSSNVDVDVATASIARTAVVAAMTLHMMCLSNDVSTSHCMSLSVSVSVYDATSTCVR